MVPKLEMVTIYSVLLLVKIKWPLSVVGYCDVPSVLKPWVQFLAFNFLFICNIVIIINNKFGQS